MRRALLVAGALFLPLLTAACGSSEAEALQPEGGVLLDGAVTHDATTPPPSRDGGFVLPDASFPLPDASWTPSEAGGCGYMDAGAPLHVATNLDLCMPKVVCNAETCPPQLGTCENGACVFQPGYSGVATLPESWVTYYCDLSSEGCHGVTQVQFAEVTAQEIATARNLPLCADNDAGAPECMGVAAAPAMVVGNSQDAIDPRTGKSVTDWGQGLTEASGLCYELTGPAGTALVALTDRCGGYCKCNGSAFEECGPCVNATDMVVNCPCVGTAPPAYVSCCGATCGGTLNAQCDWCASNSHPHFDLDIASFNHVCGSLAYLGSCQLSGVRYFPCYDPNATGWPPP